MSGICGSPIPSPLDVDDDTTTTAASNVMRLTDMSITPERERNLSDESADGEDRDQLEGFGYQEVLRRTMGLMRATAVNISTSSVATAVFTLFAYGIITGGTGLLVWTWLIGFVVMLLVTLMFAELGSSMPLAGALYQWAARLVGPRTGYLTGWLYAASQIALVSAVAYGISPFIASLFGIQLTPAQQQLAAIILILACTVLNLIGVMIASAVATIGAVAEVGGMVVLIVVLFVTGFGNQPATVLVEAQGLPEDAHMWAAFGAAMLFGSWAWTGLEMATDMAEETKDASKVIPRAGISSIITTFLVGIVFLIAAVLAIPGTVDDIVASANPLQAIIEGNTGAVFYKLIAVVIIVAVFVCAMTNQALTARIIFSLARDRRVPFSSSLAKVPAKTQVPHISTVLVGVIACAIIVFIDALAAITTACLTGLFLCYVLVVWAQLVQRLRGRWTPHQWSLGKFSLPANVLAAVLGTALTLNLAWPRSEDVWYNRYSSVLFVLLVVILAGIYYLCAGDEGRRAIKRIESVPPPRP
jgi:amino acid transporter